MMDEESYLEGYKAGKEDAQLANKAEGDSLRAGYAKLGEDFEALSGFIMTNMMKMLEDKIQNKDNPDASDLYHQSTGAAFAFNEVRKKLADIANSQIAYLLRKRQNTQ